MKTKEIKLLSGFKLEEVELHLAQVIADASSCDDDGDYAKLFEKAEKVINNASNGQGRFAKAHRMAKAIGRAVIIPFWPRRITMARVGALPSVLYPRKPMAKFSKIFDYLLINMILLELTALLKQCGHEVNNWNHSMNLIGSLWNGTFGKQWNFFEFFEEVRARSYEEFEQFDHHRLITTRGEIFGKNEGNMLFYAMYMTEQDIRLAQWVFAIVCGFFVCKGVKDGEKSAEDLITAVFINDRYMWMERIHDLRRGIIDRLIHYCDNMIEYAGVHNYDDGARRWNDVACKLRKIGSLVPGRDKMALITRMIDDCLNSFNAIGRDMYLECFRKPVSAVGLQTTSKQGDWPTLCSKGAGRFKFKWHDGKLTITDKRHKEGKKYLNFEKLSGKEFLTGLEALMVEYAIDPDNKDAKTLLPPGDSWRSCAKGEGAHFVNTELETYSKAFPDADDKDQHLGEYRIIPDGKELR